jgi:hypothetical protein
MKDEIEITQSLEGFLSFLILPPSSLDSLASGAAGAASLSNAAEVETSEFLPGAENSHTSSC